MKNKGKNDAGLHKFIATGGKPSDYRGSKGISEATVNNIKKSDNKK